MAPVAISMSGHGLSSIHRRMFILRLRANCALLQSRPFSERVSKRRPRRPLLVEPSQSRHSDSPTPDLPRTDSSTPDSRLPHSPTADSSTNLTTVPNTRSKALSPQRILASTTVAFSGRGDRKAFWNILQPKTDYDDDDDDDAADDKTKMDKPAPKKPAPPRPSASVLLLSPTNEILLLHRVQTSSAFPSAHVFPGGNVSSFHDGELPDENDVPAFHGEGEAYRRAAVRECFEESGILLARRKDGGVLVETGGLAGLTDEEREQGRRNVHEDRVRFGEWCEQRKVVACLDDLIPFTHWITPPAVPKRFTTQMYLYMLPLQVSSPSTATSGSAAPSTTATHDGGREHTAASWARPETWLVRAALGEIILPPPQTYLLHQLAQAFRSLPPDQRGKAEEERKALLDRVRSAPDGRGTLPLGAKTICPKMLVKRDDGSAVMGLAQPAPEVGQWLKRLGSGRFYQGESGFEGVSGELMVVKVRDGRTMVRVGRREDILTEEEKRRIESEGSEVWDRRNLERAAQEEEVLKKTALERGDRRRRREVMMEVRREEEEKERLREEMGEEERERLVEMAELSRVDRDKERREFWQGKPESDKAKVGDGLEKEMKQDSGSTQAADSKTTGGSSEDAGPKQTDGDQEIPKQEHDKSEEGEVEGDVSDKAEETTEPVPEAAEQTQEPRTRPKELTGREKEDVWRMVEENVVGNEAQKKAKAKKTAPSRAVRTEESDDESLTKPQKKAAKFLKKKTAGKFKAKF